jgi:molybdopterin biosynthesis enzyme
MADEPETQRITRLTPLAEALGRIDALVSPVTPREIEVTAALGRVAAGDISIGSRPATAIALRDGFAVHADLTSDATTYAPTAIAAATRIDTGEPMPAGADAVAPLDIAVLRDGGVELIAPVVAGEGVLAQGADAGGGTPPLRAGRRVGRNQLAVLASASVRRLFVHEPRLRVVRARNGSDRVIEAAINLVAGDISERGGLVPPLAQSASETPLQAALEEAGVEAVVAIGGTGRGRDDARVRTLARLGRLEMHGIALSPGETTAVGFVGSRPVLLLPGRLDAAIAAWLTVGRHLLARLCSWTAAEPNAIATLSRKVVSPLGLAEVLPMSCGGGTAEPIASGYWPLQTIAEADGWILVPAEREGYPAGAEVVVRPWP